MTNTCNNMDDAQKHYTENKKSQTEKKGAGRYTYDSTYMKV